MWSVGIITTLILTGESVFEMSQDEDASSAANLDAAAQYNLAKIDHGSAWQVVCNLGKGFVKGLLVLDENVRFNVGQALEHGWFTDGKRKKRIQRKYEEAIRGWMPSRPLLDFKEDLSLFKEASKSAIDVRSSTTYTYPSVLTICQSILMPPPGKPTSSGPLQRPLQAEFQSSRFFPRATPDDSTRVSAQAGKKRELEGVDEVNTPLAVPAKKRRNMDSQEESHDQSGKERPAKNPAEQVDVGEETLVQVDLSQRLRQHSTDLDYDERRLHDRVSREEASIFRSAKSFGQCVEERRRLENSTPAPAMGPSIFS